jgi:hypothetical protein
MQDTHWVIELTDYLIWKHFEAKWWQKIMFPRWFYRRTLK